MPGKKLADGGGLYLFMPPAGSANWRIKYRIQGKEKVFSVGPYPLVSLSAARIQLAEVKALLLENKDPVAERRLNRASAAAGLDNTFKAVSQEWLTMKQREWSATHYTKSARALERDVPRPSATFPSEISPPPSSPRRSRTSTSETCSKRRRESSSI
jgi:hypothetical protein